MTTLSQADFNHQPALLSEAIEGLAIVPDGCYIDGTFGRGGHACAILARLGAKGRLILLDRDSEAVVHAQQILGADARVVIEQTSFADMRVVADKYALIEKVQGVLLDLGVSSPQLDDAVRGFSFLREGPLDMRMDTSQALDAARWLAQAEEMEIAEVLKTYGEERFAKRIAAAIVKTRREHPFQTTTQLAEVVARAHPRWEPHKHPATRTFQAIRIFINQELTALQQCLAQILDVLAIGGRLAVISFHSLEDRIVKQFIQRMVKGDDYPADLPITQAALQPRMRWIAKGVRASEAELQQNIRARSAVLRIAEKLA